MEEKMVVIEKIKTILEELYGTQNLEAGLMHGTV